MSPSLAILVSAALSNTVHGRGRHGTSPYRNARCRLRECWVTARRRARPGRQWPREGGDVMREEYHPLTSIWERGRGEGRER
ncbi:hypothetical protein E2C01_010628 [Portunus trituberculatus]|uniref:Uncharacterized protein n=1 Tax=Portunus trituberculatus TaxID=210409 RepID=A0A5B7D8Y8_PORTR|nr:hypothetical protein [Portunus trituberculatus]